MLLPGVVSWSRDTQRASSRHCWPANAESPSLAQSDLSGGHSEIGFDLYSFIYFQFARVRAFMRACDVTGTSGTSMMKGRFWNSGGSSLTSVIKTLTVSTTWNQQDHKHFVDVLLLLFLKSRILPLLQLTLLRPSVMLTCSDISLCF